MSAAETVKVTLSRGIEHGDDVIDEIALREITVADLNKCGYPLSIGDDGKAATPIPANISALICRCGRVPPSVVGKMTARDFNACMTVILGFLEGAEAS